MLETLDYSIRIGSIPTFLYFDLYLYSAYAAHFVYLCVQARANLNPFLYRRSYLAINVRYFEDANLFSRFTVNSVCKCNKNPCKYGSILLKYRFFDFPPKATSVKSVFKKHRFFPVYRLTASLYL